MDSWVVERIFRLLTSDYWASERAKAGMTPTDVTVPRGVLTDDDACARLLNALVQEVGAGHHDVRSSNLSFYQVGDYYAVFSELRVHPELVGEVKQRHPMRIYSMEQKPRLLMTVYM